MYVSLVDWEVVIARPLGGSIGGQAQLGDIEAVGYGRVCVELRQNIDFCGNYGEWNRKSYIILLIY